MKNKSLIFLIISVFLLLTSCKTDKTADKTVIFSDGETNYSIVVEEGASDEVLELAQALYDLSGADPEICTDSSPETALEILIGGTSRDATTALLPEFKEKLTISALHFMIAETSGKLVIVSDSEVGYIYALEYIKENYLSDGTLAIPTGTREIKQVTWTDYYASDLYYDRLLAAADSDRFAALRELLESEGSRYEDKGNSITTFDEAILACQRLNASFRTESFGDYDAAVFVDQNNFKAPSVSPTSDSHPRILFTENTIDEVRSNLTNSQNAAQYKKYLLLSNTVCDGMFGEIPATKEHNFNYDYGQIIEAKAFRFAMERDAEKYPNVEDDPASLYGYEAIYAIKNAILTVNVPNSVGDGARLTGSLMYVAACVYDWCYELLTDDDKDQLIYGNVNLLGMTLEIVRYDGSTNKVPSSQDPAYGHGAEYQLLKDYLAFSIACYDEAPEIYDYCAGRVLSHYVDVQNYLAASGSHWNGTYYGPFREGATAWANILINKMTDGTVTPFTDIDEIAITQTYCYRPDGKLLLIGDVNDQDGRAYDWSYDASFMFLTGNFYENSYLKSYGYMYSSGFTSFYQGTGGLSPVEFLALNDPEVDYVYEGTAPLTRTTTYPLSNIFAKSANDDKNAYYVYMTMPETFIWSHAHADCGSFQIYYNGSMLIADSGCYNRPWGSVHHMGYYMQTVSANSILVYNPNLAGTYNSYRKNLTYSGGQSVASAVYFPYSLAELLAYAETTPRYFQCNSLGKANVEVEIDGEQVYLYSYIGGDMTMAYDQETVDEVSRYMLSVATGDEDCPYIFLTFDRITSDDASYKKTALIHTHTEPTIKDNYAIVTNGDGRLVVQTVGEKTTMTRVGGEGNEFVVNGINNPVTRTLKGDNAEYGWGRIELTPTTPDKTNTILSVMYVTDSENNDLIEAKSITATNLTGTEILGQAVLFSKTEKLLTTESSFTLTSGADCYIAGVSAGTWNIMNGDSLVETVTVEEGTNLITFTATEAGTYTIKPAN